MAQQESRRQHQPERADDRAEGEINKADAHVVEADEQRKGKGDNAGGEHDGPLPVAPGQPERRAGQHDSRWCDQVEHLAQRRCEDHAEDRIEEAQHDEQHAEEDADDGAEVKAGFGHGRAERQAQHGERQIVNREGEKRAEFEEAVVMRDALRQKQADHTGREQPECAPE